MGTVAFETLQRKFHISHSFHKYICISISTYFAVYTIIIYKYLLTHIHTNIHTQTHKHPHIFTMGKQPLGSLLLIEQVLVRKSCSKGDGRLELHVARPDDHHAAVLAVPASTASKVIVL